MAIMMEPAKTMTLTMLNNMCGLALPQSSHACPENETKCAGVSLAKTGNFTRKAAGGSFQVSNTNLSPLKDDFEFIAGYSGPWFCRHYST